MHFANSKKTAGYQKVCRQLVEKVRCSGLSLQSLFALHLKHGRGKYPKKPCCKSLPNPLHILLTRISTAKKVRQPKNYSAAFSFSLPSSFPIKSEEIVTVTSEHAIFSSGI